MLFELLSPMITLVIVFIGMALTISIGIGMTFGGPEGVKKVLAWEMKQVSSVTKWSLKKSFSGIEAIARWAKNQF